MKKNKPNRAESLKARRAAEALAAAAAIAGGTQAYAAPVRFDNPPGAGHFNWVPAADGDFVDLDLTAGPASQTATTPGGAVLRQGYFLFGFPPYPAVNPYSYLGSAPNQGPQLTSINGPFARYVDDIAAGTTVNAALPFSAIAFSNVAIYYRYVATGQIYSYIPNNTSVYVGTRLTLADGVHFGWMRVQRSGRSLDALAWGYETTPNTPITAGASGALPGDMNDDHVVDAADIPAFVASLLGNPLPPGSVDRADMNGDSAKDGADIQPFANAIIH